MAIINLYAKKNNHFKKIIVFFKKSVDKTETQRYNVSVKEPRKENGEMVNTLKLRAKIVESGCNLESFAKKIGMTRQSLSNKLNNDRCFTTDEIMQFCKSASIPIEDLTTYFFC